MGLGQQSTFDPVKLIPDPEYSFREGCCELVGPWSDLGRWRKHIFAGVAESLERDLGLESDSILKTPWQDLDEPVRQALLYGTGERHITYTWRSGRSIQKYGGQFDSGST